MNKNQIDNLIRFSVAFHISHNNLLTCDPSYIVEKWDKYIGIKPKKLEFILYGHNSYLVNEWRERWNVDDNNYNEIKGIIYFINKINEKHFFIRRNYSEKVWITSDLITLFEELVGPLEKINKNIYNHLHPNIVKIMDKWKDDTTIGRDYQLCLLV